VCCVAVCQVMTGMQDTYPRLADLLGYVDKADAVKAGTAGAVSRVCC
jgi:hypothetical protein